MRSSTIIILAATLCSAWPVEMIARSTTIAPSDNITESDLAAALDSLSMHAPALGPASLQAPSPSSAPSQAPALNSMLNLTSTNAPALDLASVHAAAEYAASLYGASLRPIKSRNWSGRVLNAPVGKKFHSVTGTFTIPIPEPPKDHSGTGQWVGAAWVGIDGTPDVRISADVQLRNTLIQAGIVWIVKRDKMGKLSRSYEPFTEWVPATEQKIKDFNVKGGDTVTITCEVENPILGSCSFYSHQNNQNKTVSIGAADVSEIVDQHSAEWIVERTTLISEPSLFSLLFAQTAAPPELEHFGNYTDVEFRQTIAKDYDGVEYGHSGAREYQLVDDKMRPMSKCTASGHFRLLCKYLRGE